MGSSQRSLVRILALTASAASCAVLSGCLVSGSSNTSMSGKYVGPSTFSQVEPGVTSEEWVLAAFGQPTSRTSLSTGADLLKWEFTRTQRGSGSVFLLYGGSNSRETQGAAFVEVRDGVVTKAWRD